jgi:cysteine desulfurase/selenocysteine lyase
MAMDPTKIRQDFPILQKKSDKPLIYFDNACMTLRPVQVINAIKRYYEEFPACAGRSHHMLGKLVAEEVEKSRKTMKDFLGAKNEKEIIFTKNTTEGINLVAHSLSLKAGDVVLTTDREHNSNLLPWQQLARIGVKHEIIKSRADGTFDLEAFQKRMDRSVKLVSVVHTSNLDGTTVPAEKIIKAAHDWGALVLLDAAQSVPHKEANVAKLNVDFLACSGHKMMGPSGTGILYGKYDLLEKMNPFIVGGGTVVDSTYSTATYEKPPDKFEAGLQDYAGIIGLAEAARYIDKIGRKSIEQHETELNKIVTSGLLKLDGISLIGPADSALRSGIISFNVGKIGSHEVALLLDKNYNIAVRSGAHCVHSWFNAHNLKGSVRASLYAYNTKEEAAVFLDAMQKLVKVLVR